MSDGFAYTVEKVLAWDFGSARTVSDRLTSKSADLRGTARAAATTFDGSLEYWRSDGGRDARESSNAHADAADRSATVIESLAGKFDSLLASMEGEIANVRSKKAEALGSEFELAVAGDGEVYSTKSNLEWLKTWKLAYQVKIVQKESLESYLTKEIRGSLRRIEEIDKVGSEGLRRILEKLPDSVKAGAAGHHSDPRLAEILREYQVDASKGGARLWPSGDLLDTIRRFDPTFKPTLMTPEEVTMLAEMGAVPVTGWRAVYDFFQIQSKADTVSQQRHPNAGDSKRSQADGHGDAFRHTYWNALMTDRFGKDWTERFATAHEGLGGNPAHREAMDLYNNELGRRIASENTDATPEELADLVDRAMADGRTLVLDTNGKIEWSDNVEKHRTGIALKTDIPLQMPGR
ncbi:hypothetical protein [Gordonia sp. SCSIO 19800]|uniref:DUF6973 domain-containing protein n=1 Tax=Gordonia sp. SCSIO 19800 TaxID=2826926 RepID=UPI001B80F6A8|nr:hypothetical protein [Gordonia sp. SCSIO 19800]MBR7193880.1 hypothetical protein [Gordonia sp. SCSIO 19800]